MNKINIRTRRSFKYLEYDWCTYNCRYDLCWDYIWTFLFQKTSPEKNPELSTPGRLIRRKRWRKRRLKYKKGICLKSRYDDDNNKICLIFNSFTANTTLVCGWRSEHAKHNYYRVNISELLENFEETFSRYYMHSDGFSRRNSSTTR